MRLTRWRAAVLDGLGIVVRSLLLVYLFFAAMDADWAKAIFVALVLAFNEAFPELRRIRRAVESNARQPKS